jgi:hypothetical protein
VFKIGLLPDLIPDYIATAEGPPQVGPKAPGPPNIFLTIFKTHQSFIITFPLDHLIESKFVSDFGHLANNK